MTRYHNVVNVKLAVSVSIERPGAVVADDLLTALRDLGGLCWRLSGLCRSVCGPVTDPVSPVPGPVALLQVRVEGSAGRTLVALTHKLQRAVDI